MTLNQIGQNLHPAFPPVESHAELVQISSEAENCLLILPLWVKRKATLA